MALVAALGANLWILAVAVPLLLGHSWGAVSAPGGLLGVTALVSAAPAVLLYGLARRSDQALLGAFPVAALLPQVLLASGESRLIPPVPFVLAAASLVGFLVAAARFLAAPGTGPAPAATVKSLAGAPVPARWRRRLRVYRALAILAVVIPAVLIAYADLWPPSTARIAESFAGREAAAQTLLTAGIGLLSMVLYRAYLLAPMQAHLAHDRDLIAHVEAARRQAKKGRPRPAFYLAVTVALVAMIVVVWQRAGAPGGRP